MMLTLSPGELFALAERAPGLLPPDVVQPGVHFDDLGRLDPLDEPDRVAGWQSLRSRGLVSDAAWGAEIEELLLNYLTLTRGISAFDIGTDGVVQRSLHASDEGAVVHSSDVKQEHSFVPVDPRAWPRLVPLVVLDGPCPSGSEGQDRSLEAVLAGIERVVKVIGFRVRSSGRPVVVTATLVHTREEVLLVDHGAGLARPVAARDIDELVAPLSAEEQDT
jgi:hypothetical protein